MRRKPRRERPTIRSTGLRIKLLRESLGMTQLELAERADISRTYVQALEGNRKTPSIKLLGKLGNILKVDPGSLIPSGGDSGGERIYLEEIFDRNSCAEYWYKNRRITEKEVEKIEKLISALLD
ncbi:MULTISPECIES: helix-turn-helix domain-containing protein [Dethiosulfovibrio]|uniref:Helix-turn-helix domain-containing protein n=1 Tax=Dethiosulfovibrio acidaminovorans TaxID=133535 RepID=A0ABS9ESX8_9BACT|nr:MULTISPECIES: helix-turn-helix transcriptional regulator [Dethiosulfovibrio]MCF4144325.1 helix-turn-helix domain-containing protein [Dethiosulfovibrio acidaminovorans]